MTRIATKIPTFDLLLPTTRVFANVRSKLPLLLVSILAVLPFHAEAQYLGGDYCLVREGRVPVVGAKHTALYERKLFVTEDDVARYVFLTNGRNDGDRSAAVYRAPSKAGSLPDGYWITSTEASVSLLNCIPTSVEKARVDLRSVKVRRADAPLPATTAKAVHKLWISIVERSRIDERAVPFSPTGIFAVITPTGERRSAVTAWQSQYAFCDALVGLGEFLFDYAKLPFEKRSQAADNIERESNRLLRRLGVTRGHSGLPPILHGGPIGGRHQILTAASEGGGTQAVVSRAGVQNVRRVS